MISNFVRDCEKQLAELHVHAREASEGVPMTEVEAGSTSSELVTALKPVEKPRSAHENPDAEERARVADSSNQAA